MSGVLAVVLGAAGGAFVFNHTIAANTADFNLRSAAVAAGWDQSSPLKATVTVNSGIYVYSTSTSTPAFDTGSGFPAGTELTLINHGLIVGRGGNGGAGGLPSVPGGNGTNGTAGGPAFKAQHAIVVENYGTIGGGGGGGGGGAGWSGGYAYFSGAGGGGGRANGVGGPQGNGVGPYGTKEGQPGQTATLASRGLGGAAWPGYAPEGQGGNGGDLGASGTNGDQPFGQNTGGSGAGAGAAVQGNSFITWSITGTRLGAIT